MAEQYTTYHCDLESHPRSLRLLDPFLRSIPEFEVLQGDRYHDALLVLTEAVSNAIAHGNQYQLHQLVSVDISLQQGGALIVVRDHGSGFDPSQIPDPRLPEHLLNEGGRGVFLMRHLAHAIDFERTPSGMIVRITVRW